MILWFLYELKQDTTLLPLNLLLPLFQSLGAKLTGCHLKSLGSFHQTIFQKAEVLFQGHGDLLVEDKNVI